MIWKRLDWSKGALAVVWRVRLGLLVATGGAPYPPWSLALEEFIARLGSLRHCASIIHRIGLGLASYFSIPLLFSLFFVVVGWWCFGAWPAVGGIQFAGWDFRGRAAALDFVWLLWRLWVFGCSCGR